MIDAGRARRVGRQPRRLRGHAVRSGAAGGGVVDSAALDAYAAQVTGADGVLASTARSC